MTYSITDGSLQVNSTGGGYCVSFPVPIEAGKKYKINFTESGSARRYYRFYDSINDIWTAGNVQFNNSNHSVFDNSETTYEWLLLCFGAATGAQAIFENIVLEEYTE